MWGERRAIPDRSTDGPEQSQTNNKPPKPTTVPHTPKQTHKHEQAHTPAPHKRVRAEAEPRRHTQTHLTTQTHKSTVRLPFPPPPRDLGAVLGVTQHRLLNTHIPQKKRVDFWANPKGCELKKSWKITLSWLLTLNIEPILLSVIEFINNKHQTLNTCNLRWNPGMAS